MHRRSLFVLAAALTLSSVTPIGPFSAGKSSTAAAAEPGAAACAAVRHQCIRNCDRTTVGGRNAFCLTECDIAHDACLARGPIRSHPIQTGGAVGTCTRVGRTC